MSLLSVIVGPVYKNSGFGIFDGGNLSPFLLPRSDFGSPHCIMIFQHSVFGKKNSQSQEVHIFSVLISDARSANSNLFSFAAEIYFLSDSTLQLALHGGVYIYRRFPNTMSALFVSNFYSSCYCPQAGCHSNMPEYPGIFLQISLDMLHDR